MGVEAPARNGPTARRTRRLPSDARTCSGHVASLITGARGRARDSRARPPLRELLAGPGLSSLGMIILLF